MQRDWYYIDTDSFHNTYFFNDTLWDGAGCIDNCYDDTTQPWFYHQLNSRPHKMTLKYEYVHMVLFMIDQL